MANIFSGILGGQPAGPNAAELAQYKQQLTEYDEERQRYNRLRDIANMQGAISAATADMTPERQAQMKLAEMMMGSQTMGDTGQEMFSRSMGQRGGTIADQQRGEIQVDVHRRKTLFDLANPEQTQDPAKIATAKQYIGEDEYNRLQRSTDPKDREKLRSLMRDSWRDRQLVETETGFVDPYQNVEVINKNFIQAGVDKAVAEKNAKRLTSFYDDVNQTEFFLENTATQRERVQRLYRNVEGNTGWWALAASIPDIKSEGGSREWQQIRDTVVSNVGLDKILDLKASSSQGATGLGALNEKELEMLQKHKGSLEQANSPESLRRVLLQMDRDMDLLQKRRIQALGRERSWFNRNKGYMGIDPSLPDLIPESQEYLFSGKPYVPVRGESPLMDMGGEMTDEDLIQKWSMPNGQ